MKIRNKHGKEKRAKFGKSARHELAFIGAPCSLIQEMAQGIASENKEFLSIGYLDASHEDGFQNEYVTAGFDRFEEVVTHGFSRIVASQGNDFDSKFQNSMLDLLLINGNHHLAEKHVVILDARKTESLSRKMDRIEDILFIVDVDGEKNIPDFLRNHPNFSEQIPVVDAKNNSQIAELVNNWMKSLVPELKGLVLAGGKSLRMGKDKGSIHYHQEDQRSHTAKLLSGFCSEVYVSLRPDQNVESNYPILRDVFLDMGPLGAILSAMKSDPDSAWLVVACDLPLLNQAAIQKLVDSRSSSHVGTAYKKSEDAFPEPLVAILEPKVYGRALQFLSLGYQCPRKVLINSKIKTILPENPEWLTNVNLPEELEVIKKRIDA